MKNTLEKIKKAFDTKFIKILTFTVIIVAVLLMVFEVGMSVGYRKAKFSYKMGDNYYRAFGRPGDMMGGHPGMKPGPGGMHFPKEDFTSSHGAVGKIIKIDLPTIVVATSDNVEKTVLVGSSTMIRKYRDNIGAADLHINDPILIIGSPNEESEIEAKFIRIMPDVSNEINSATTTRK